MNSNYQEDVRISDNIVTQCAEIYRRIRNTLFKFCLANISDFDFNKDQQNAFRDEDKYVLYQLNENATKIHQAYQEYDFMTIIKIINNHVIDLSSWYFDLIKDTIYCETKNHPVRRVIQTVLYHILLTYLKLLAPIIPHTAEEVYSFMSLPNKKTSIVLEHYEPTKLNSFDINKAK
jgi:isoleucyl-tRNA synthetase